MKKWGLACAGTVGRTRLSALPLLSAELGPVASTSFRLATRIANSLKAGFPVRSLGELDQSATILVCALGVTKQRLEAELSRAALDWKGKILLAFDSGSYSCDFLEFRRQGASVASLNAVDGYQGRYVVEGDRDALRVAKVLARALRGKIIEVNSEGVRLYDAGRTLAGSLFTPLIESCVECLRQAGIPGPVATATAEALLQRSLRSFMHAGRKSWGGPVAQADRETLDREYQAVTQANPLMGAYFRHSTEFALAFYRTFPELTRYNPARWRKAEPER